LRDRFTSKKGFTMTLTTLYLLIELDPDGNVYRCEQSGEGNGWLWTQAANHSEWCIWIREQVNA
jgi:hypothetical protein